MLSFERGKKVTEVLNVGRGPGAFRVTEVTLKMVVYQEEPYGGYAPPLGRYFRNENENEWDLPLPKAYVLLQMALKKKNEDLRNVVKFILADLDHRYNAHFTFFFKGEEGEVKLKDVITGPDCRYHWKDLAGMDLIVDNKMLKIPEGRLLPDTDFQFCLSGDLGPARPGPV